MENKQDKQKTVSGSNSTGIPADKMFIHSGKRSSEKRFLTGGELYRVADFAFKIRLDAICANCKKPYADHKGMYCSL